MKKQYLTAFLFLLIFNSNATYTWQQLTSMPNVGRLGTAGFAIGNKIYYGLGDNNFNVQFNDLWEYDPSNDTWTQKALFPGGARVSTTFFSLNDYGYFGLGWSSYSGGNAYNSFFKYDAILNQWFPISNYPGSASFNAIAFVINGFAYVGCGGPGSGKNFYKYDPINDIWTFATTFPGSVYQSATAFSVNNIGYICGGWDGNNVVNDLWAYNPIINIWTQKAGIPIARGSAISFVFGNKVFVGTGGLAGNFGGSKDMFEYDYLADSWSIAPIFPGNPLAGLRGTVIGNTGYGFGGGDASIGYFSSEIWKFSEITSIEFYTNSHLDPFCYFNNGELFIKDPASFKAFELYSISGSKIISLLSGTINNKISLKQYNLGTSNYIYKLLDKSGNAYSGKIFIKYQ